MIDPDATRPRIVQSNQIDETGNCGQQRADGAAAKRVERGYRPGRIAGDDESEVADHGEDPKADRQCDQHRMDGMPRNTCASAHSNLLEARIASSKSLTSLVCARFPCVSADAYVGVAEPSIVLGHLYR